MPRATLSLLSCPPNFLRAATTRNMHAKHGPILYFLMALNSWPSVYCQLISEVDNFDAVWLYEDSLFHIILTYTFFCLQLSCPTCPIWTLFPKLNCELPNFFPYFCLFYFHISSFIVKPTIILLYIEAKLWLFLFIIQTTRGHLDQLAW